MTATATTALLRRDLLERLVPPCVDFEHAGLPEHIVADEISIDGALDGQFALRTGDLTKIDFGGGYELAPWRMIQSAKRVDSS